MKIFFSVGEPSGDQHAAHLIEKLSQLYPDFEPIGFGGPHMQDAGCRIDFQLTDMAVMGILEVLPLIQKFRALVRQATEILQRERPAAVVLVDFPGFNWWIARAAKGLGIPVFYYCPPQLWAWAGWRIRKVRRSVDHVLACLPFEAEWYRQRGVDAECVGHPFFDEVAEKQLNTAFLTEQRARTGRCVAILPGSRNREVRANFAAQTETMRQLHAQFPDVRFLVANYRDSQRQECEAWLREHAPEVPAECHTGRTSEILELADCTLMVSGSVSLEVLARTVPAVVLYRVDYLFGLIAKLLVTCRYMSLPNLVAGEPLMPEFPMIGSAKPHIPRIVAQLQEWLASPLELARRRQALRGLRDSLMRTGATETAARSILAKLGAAVPDQQRRAA